MFCNVRPTMMTRWTCLNVVMRAILALAATSLPRPRVALLAPTPPLRARARAAALSLGSSGDAPPTLELTLCDSADTLALGATLASIACAGDAMLLHGDYGAGKTCLARGFVRRWYDDPSELVTSPSYLIDNVYDDDDGRARLPGVAVHHMDLWRLPEGKIRELVDLSHVFADCVSLIEWPERLGAELMPEAHLDVHLAIVDEAGAETQDARPEEGEGDDEQPRLATLTARGETWQRRLEAIRDEMRAAVGTEGILRRP